MFGWATDAVRTPGRDNPSNWGGEGWFLFIVCAIIFGALGAWLGGSILSWLDVLFMFDRSRAVGVNDPSINPFAIFNCVGTFFATIGAILGFIAGVGIAWVAAARVPEPRHH